MEDKNIIAMIVRYLEKNVGKKALTTFHFNKEESVLSFGIRGAKFKLDINNMECYQEVKMEVMFGATTVYTKTESSNVIANWLREYMQEEGNQLIIFGC